MTTQKLVQSKSTGETFVTDGAIISAPLTQDEVDDITAAFARGESVNIDGEASDLDMSAVRTLAVCGG